MKASAPPIPIDESHSELPLFSEIETMVWAFERTPWPCPASESGSRQKEDEETMKFTSPIVGLVVTAAQLIGADAELRFEAAVVKRYDHSNDRDSLPGVIPVYGCRVGPGMLQFNCSGPIQMLVAESLNLSDFQFQRPDLSHMSNEVSYSITAKLSKPATRQEIGEMMGNLLREKMGVRYHMEKRPIKAEFLTVASKELLSKLPESKDSIPFADEADSGPRWFPTQMFMQFTETDYSNPNRPQNEVDINCKNITFYLFAQLLHRYYSVPVIDQTGLAKRFNLRVVSCSVRGWDQL
jgi:uncharacterized protein (TIGR03435 family)